MTSNYKSIDGDVIDVRAAANKSVPLYLQSTLIDNSKAPFFSEILQLSITKTLIQHLSSGRIEICNVPIQSMAYILTLYFLLLLSNEYYNDNKDI
jgi:hypothetical protein